MGGFWGWVGDGWLWVDVLCLDGWVRVWTGLVICGLFLWFPWVVIWFGWVLVVCVLVFVSFELGFV